MILCQGGINMQNWRKAGICKLCKARGACNMWKRLRDTTIWFCNGFKYEHRKGV